MQNAVMSGEEMIPARKAVVFAYGNEVETRRAVYENKLGEICYMTMIEIEDGELEESVKILDIGGVSPTSENAASGAYPFVVDFYGVVREDDGPESAGRKFLEWILSDEGQRCAAQAGYTPLA
jgi:phosphate transport system substrate-binding protein